MCTIPCSPSCSQSRNVEGPVHIGTFLQSSSAIRFAEEPPSTLMFYLMHCAHPFKQTVQDRNDSEEHLLIHSLPTWSAASILKRALATPHIETGS
jgi:hypothetical protein